VVVAVDDGLVVDLPRWILPTNIRSGDVLLARSDSPGFGSRRVEIRIDAEASGAGRAAIAARLDALRSDDPGGPLRP